FISDKENVRATHLSGWRKVLTDTVAVKPVFFGLYNHTRHSFVAVLPGYISRSLVYGRCFESMPGGIIAENMEYAEVLVKDLLKRFKQEGINKLLIRGGNITRKMECLPYISLSERVHSWINLEQGKDNLWKKIHKKHRYHIRLAERHGYKTEMLNEIPNEFYNIFVNHQHRLGTPALGPALFKSINQYLSETMRFFSVRDGDKLVAGAVILTCLDHWESLYVAATVPARRQHAINILYWSFIQSAIDSGVRRFDLGRSVINSGNHIFKKKWNAIDEIVIYRLLDLRAKPARFENRLPVLKLSWIESWFPVLWRHLPLRVAVIAGPLLRRQMPIG
ncbi:MAG: GNAT family N-acetyltransferase, partial [Thermodesulfobacteriota bacterium]